MESDHQTCSKRWLPPTLVVTGVVLLVVFWGAAGYYLLRINSQEYMLMSAEKLYAKGDFVRAEEYLRKIAFDDEEHAETGKAWFLLGEIYSKTARKDSRNADRALQCYTSSASAGYPLSQLRLGQYNLEKQDPNYAEAVFWLSKAAKNGLIEADEKLAEVYFTQRQDSEESERLAFFHSERAADRGSAVGAYWLASCYAKGVGCEEDTNEGIIWLRKAAEKDYHPAQDLLGGFYIDGKYVLQSEKEGRYWLERAIQHGSSHAAAAMVIELTMGVPSPRDLKRALELANLAISREPDGFYNHFALGRVFQKEGDFEEAIKVFEAAEKLNPEYASISGCMADCYEQMGEYSKADQCWQKYLKLQKNMDKRTIALDAMRKLRNEGKVNAPLPSGQ